MKKFMAIFTGNPAHFEQWQKAHADPAERSGPTQSDSIPGFSKW